VLHVLNVRAIKVATAILKEILKVISMRILVAYWNDDDSKKLLEIAMKHAKGMNGEIILVTSLVGGTQNSADEIIAAEKNLEQAKELVVENSIACDTHLLIRKLTVGEDIVNYAREKNCGEIIIGVKSRSKVGKLIFGSTAQYVILNAECPVVTIK